MRFFAGAIDRLKSNCFFMNKYYFSFFLIAALSFTVETIYAQQVYTGKRTLYIVRHAEKDTGTNPAISTAGKQRAGDLYRSLKNKKIDIQELKK